MNKQHRQTGFTLIELIAVIVILGILAAVALPKFLGMNAEARLSKMKGAAGAVSSASAIYHAKWMSNKDALDKDDVIDGYKLNSNPVNGYPDVTDIFGLAGLDNTADYTISGGEIQDKNSSTCKFTYANAAANSVPTVDTAALTLANCE